MRNISKYIVLIALVCLIAVGIILIVRRTRISNHTPDFKMGSPYIDIENREDLQKFLKIDFDGKRLVDVEYIIDEYGIPYLIVYCDDGISFQIEYLKEGHHDPLIQEIPKGDKMLLEKKGIDLSTIKDHWETWAEYPLDQSYCSSDIHWYLFDESVNSKYDLIIIAVSSQHDNR